MSASGDYNCDIYDDGSDDDEGANHDDGYDEDDGNGGVLVMTVIIKIIILFLIIMSIQILS